MSWKCPAKNHLHFGYPENVVNLKIKSTRVAYLAKPFSVGSLTAKVREALEITPQIFED